MRNPSPILRESVNGDNHWLGFWCPGCEEMHVIHVYREGEPKRGNPSWSWNGSYETPTFKPSILVTNGCKMPNHIPGTPCWCTFNADLIAKGEPPSAFTCGRCHTYVTDGKIQFLGDCTHPLAGTTVEIPELPSHLRDEESPDAAEEREEQEDD